MKMAADEIQAKLEKIATYSIETLKRCSRDELRSMCKGVISNASRMNSSTMVNALVEATKEMRLNQDLILDEQVTRAIEQAEQLASIPQFSEETLKATGWDGEASDSETNPVNVGISKFKAIKKIVNRHAQNGETHLIRADVMSLASQLLLTESTQYAPTTLNSRRTDYIRTVRAILEKSKGCENWDSISLACDEFIREIANLLKQIVASNTKATQLKVYNANKNRENAEVVELLEYAHKILENPEDAVWTQIVQALGIVTGRRPSEIVCSARFTKLDDHWVEFKGQAKRKEISFNAENSFAIPVLAEPEKIERAIEVLAKLGKRFDYDDSSKEGHRVSLQKAGDKVSMALSRSLQNSKFTMKDFRAMYFATTYQLFPQREDTRKFIPDMGNTSDSAWGNHVLGHMGTDTNTAHSYNRYHLETEQILQIKSMLNL